MGDTSWRKTTFVGAHSSTILKVLLILARPESVAPTEQYLVSESRIARSTAFSLTFLPVTTYSSLISTQVQGGSGSWTPVDADVDPGDLLALLAQDPNDVDAAASDEAGQHHVARHEAVGVVPLLLRNVHRERPAPRVAGDEPEAALP